MDLLKDSNYEQHHIQLSITAQVWMTSSLTDVNKQRFKQVHCKGCE